MKILSKTIILAVFFTIIAGINSNYGQSESEQINSLIKQKREFNKKNKNSDVFKIQLYNGNEEQAYKIESNFRQAFTDYKVKVVYDKPDFKTQVGNFKTRLEADRAYLIIKEEFADSIVLKDKI